MDAFFLGVCLWLDTCPVVLLVTPPPIFVVGAEDEAFAFDRTISRLLEMGSSDYLDRHRALVGVPGEAADR